jgi:glutathione S-transferase
MLPILYSFRRCPYAIRARMAIYYASITVELREVSLANKPQAMLELSAKGTVPVLQLKNRVIDESLQIMLWALGQSDPDDWLSPQTMQQAQRLIQDNDQNFKLWLDKYKYWDRFPAQSQQFYRTQAEQFLVQLETLLSQHRFLLGQQLSVADIAIFPFIRQFAFVDKAWFDRAPYPNLQYWLEGLLTYKLFIQCMHKQPLWQAGDAGRQFPSYKEDN